MTAPRTLIIILNWRQPQTTIACVKSALEMTDCTFEILIIDNGSHDDSVKRLQRALPEISLLCLPENLGFAGGANRGLDQAVARGFDYALLLNNDAFATPDMLAQLLAEAAPDIALLSPKIFYHTAPDRLWFAGGIQHPYSLEMRQHGQGQLDGNRWSNSRDVDYLVGTGLLINLRAMQQVGPLDERYFMYYEDLDWSIRFRNAGYRLRLVAGARLDHHVSLSSGSDSPLLRYHLGRSSVIFFRRHAHLGAPMLILLFRLGSSLKQIGRLILLRKRRAASAYVQGLVDGWRADEQQ
jgi:GT2 family glycosyltransferase